MSTLKKIIPLLLALGLLAPALRAQTYSIAWYKISGGGGTSTNGQYALSGTIGQHDAGTAMTGGGLFPDRRFLEFDFRGANGGRANADHHPFRQQRHGLLARHGRLHLATKQ